MVHQRFIQSFLKVRRMLCESQLNAAGWKVGLIDPASVVQEMTYCYIFDNPTGWIWMCAIPRDIFVDLCSKENTSPNSDNSIVQSLSYLIARCADGKKNPDVDGIDWERQLGFLTNAYARMTQCWGLANKNKAENHFAVINYRKPRASNGTLRPFMVSSAASPGVIQYDMFREMVGGIIARDRQHHPDWVAGD